MQVMPAKSAESAIVSARFSSSFHRSKDLVKRQRFDEAVEGAVPASAPRATSAHGRPLAATGANENPLKGDHHLVRAGAA